MISCNPLDCDSMVKLIKNRKNYKCHATSGNRNRTYKAEGEEIYPFLLPRIFRKIFLSEKKACNQRADPYVLYYNKI